MAQQWRYPAVPLLYQPGTAVTAAALTSALAPNPLPALPPFDRPGGRLIIEAVIEMTSTSSTPTLTVGLYIGSIGQAIGSKLLMAATPALALSASAAAWLLQLRYVARIQKLSPSVGVIYGTGWYMQATSLSVLGSPVPFPQTQALRTVSTVNTDQSSELDLGMTLSSSTGPSMVLTDFAAEYSG
jgi:hypothetical protein